MKLRVIAMLTGMVLAATLSAQTLTDVINEFNAGVENVNNQEYDASLEHFYQVLDMAEAVGDSASDLKNDARDLIPASYYKQALLFLKRRQFDNAIPYLEQTIEKANEYGNNDESKQKASRYLMQSYMMEGQRNFKNEAYDQALDNFDKALEMNENLYQANLGKGMVYYAENEADMMMDAFNKAKEGAMAKNDTETVDQINDKIDDYYNQFITEEMEMLDTEQPDYEYVIEACEDALAANPGNARALYHMALISNKNVEYDAAIDYAEKALENEDDPVWISAIYFELGTAYQNSAEYDKACEALNKVVEEPFLTRAEKKLSSVPGCN